MSNGTPDPRQGAGAGAVGKGKGKGKAVLARAKASKEWFDSTHAGLMLQRVNDGNGNLLAGGIAYLSLASLAAALAIAITLSTYLVLVNPGWNTAFFGFVDDTIPGVIKSCPGSECSGLVYPSSLEPHALTGIVGVVSFLILANTATRYLSALRVGTRTMLGQERYSPAKGKLRDLIVLLALIVVVVLGMALQVLASQVSQAVAGLISDEPLSEWLIRGPAFGVGVVVDMAFVALAIVVLGGLKRPRGPLVWTLLVAGIGIGLLRQGVSFVVGSTANNPVLGSVASVVTIMIFVNFIARIILYAAAWLGVIAGVADHAPRGRGGKGHVVPMEPMAERRHGTVTTRRASTLRPYGHRHGP